MTTDPKLIETTEQEPVLGKIIAEDVSEDDYVRDYPEGHYEWVRGFVVEMSPVTSFHDDISRYLDFLLGAYFSVKPIGRVKADPFVMRLDPIPSRRQPDLQIILGENRANIKETYMDGPADICIEIVSEASLGTDYGEKMAEYEKGGVAEYWIIDPLRQNALFYARNADGLYQPQNLDKSGSYKTSLLEQFILHVPTLWTNPLPDFGAVWAMVNEMVK